MRFLLSPLFIALFFGTVSTAFAQSSAAPYLITTWRVQEGSFAPSGYQGKLLPNTDSSVSAAVTLVEKGLAIDLAPYTVRWSLSGKQIASGKGLARVDVSLPTKRTGQYLLRADVLNYKGSNITKTIVIPFISPEITITAPFINGQLPRSGGTLSGLPYFFSIQSLNELLLTWNINGTTSNLSAEKEISLQIEEGGSGQEITIEVEARREKATTQRADNSINLFLQ